MLIQAANFLRDRTRCRVTIQRGMKMFGDPAYPGTYTIITVANVGRRPVTISNVGSQYLGGGGFVCADTRPRLPCQLTEGQRVTAISNQNDMDYNKISHFWASSAAGQIWMANYAPWHRRLYSNIQTSIAQFHEGRLRSARAEGRKEQNAKTQ